MGRGRWRGSNGKGEMGGGQREWGEEGERGGGILQMDMIQAHGMPGWNEVTVFLTNGHFVYPCNAGYPS